MPAAWRTIQGFGGPQRDLFLNLASTGVRFTALSGRLTYIEHYNSTLLLAYCCLLSTTVYFTYTTQLPYFSRTHYQYTL